MKIKTPDADFCADGQRVLDLTGKSIGKLVKEFTQKGKKIRFKAKGNSMIPFIKDSDIITISPYTDRQPLPGDIVAYLNRKTNRLVVHRLIKLSKRSFIAKGDNCFNKDDAHGKNSIMGHVSHINNSLLMILVMSPSAKKFLAAISSTGILFFFNKIFQKIELMVK